MQNETWYDQKQVAKDDEHEPSDAIDNLAFVHLPESGNCEAQERGDTAIPPRRRMAAHAREERLRVACASCGNPIYRCAIACPACGAANRQACAVNWLGLPKPDLPADPASHALRLIAVRRCRSCATRLKQKNPRQTCECCRRELFGDDAELVAYLQLVQARFAPTLVVCFLLGLAPVVGVVPAIVFYRMHLISPLRRYVPFGSALAAKWLGRCACFAVLSIQWIPLLGIGSLPIMAAINYLIYRRAFQSAWREPANTSGRRYSCGRPPTDGRFAGRGR